MLQHIHIKDFKLIDELEIDFTQGLNIITGETGAGKSVILDAISFVLGGRGERNLVRNNCTKAVVSCIICLPSSAKSKIMSQYGITMSDDTLTIKRQINASGYQWIKVNNELINKVDLLKIATSIASIHTQSENIELLHKERQLEIIDLFGTEKMKTLKSQIQQNYFALADMKKSFEHNRERIEYYEKNATLVNYQLDELSHFFEETEDEEQLYETLKHNAGQNDKKNVFENILNLLNGEGHQGYSFDQFIGAVVAETKKDKLKTPVIEEVSSIFLEMQDNITQMKRTLEHHLENLAFDENEFREIQNKLSHIAEIKRKYKANSMAEVRSYFDKLQGSLEIYEMQKKEMVRLEREITQTSKKLEEDGFLLSDERQKIATFIEMEVTKILNLLNMQHAVLKIDIHKKNISENGQDEINFLIKTIKNADFAPLKTIASGGELSRIYFAIKTVISRVDATQINIFDEIDTGISGRTSQIIAETLHDMSLQSQIICITHSPQIAVFSDNHIHICKTEFAEYETIRANILLADQKIDEISRLIGGKTITDTTKRSAKEMILFAQKYKDRQEA